MKISLRSNPLHIREQYKKQFRDPQEVYGEAMLKLWARKKLQALRTPVEAFRLGA